MFAIGTSAIRAPPQLARAGMNRCRSPWSRIRLITGARYALNVVPKSCSDTPDSFAISQFAILDGRRRVHRLSTRCSRQPLTMSYPSFNFARSLGISSGACCRSPSIATITSPEAASNPAARAAVCPKFLASEVSRTRGSRLAIAVSASVVPSLLPSSTYTISDGRPIRRSTSVRRLCSSWTVATSLKSGTTIDSCGAPCALRDMTKAPFDDVCQIVAHEIDALADKEGARLEAAEQIELLLTGLDEPRTGPLELVVGVTGMHHQFGDAGLQRAHDAGERIHAQNACVNAAGEMRRAEMVRCGDSIVALRPRPHRRVEQRLKPPGSARVAAADRRPSFVRHADDGNAKAPGQARNDGEHGRIGVHVLVRVEMRQPDACAPQPVDLRGQLELHLGERHPAAQAGDDERLPRTAEPFIVCDERGDPAGRERGCAVHEREMNAHAERWSAARATDCVGCRRSAREQAGARQDPVIVGIEDAVVDANGQPEVVGIDDEAAYHVISLRFGTPAPRARRRRGTRATVTRAAAGARQPAGSRTSYVRSARSPRPREAHRECRPPTASGP